MASKIKGLGNWVTINGCHVFIEAGRVTKGPQKLVGRYVSELKKERNAEDLIPKNSYINSDKYKELQEEWSSLFDARKTTWDKYNEYKELAKKEAEPKPKSEWDYRDTIDSMFGETPMRYNEKGLKLLEQSKKAYEERDKVDERFQIVSDTMNSIRAREARKQIENYIPTGLESTTKTDFEGFNIKTTGVSDPDDYLKSFPTQVVSMSPKEYLQRSAYEIFDSTFESTAQSVIHDASTQKYAKMMREGTKFDMPYLNYKTKNQEGRHRAVAAYINGIDQIPVLVIGKSVAPPKKYPSGVNTPAEKRVYTRAINSGASKSEATKKATKKDKKGNLQDIFNNAIK